MNTYYIIIIIVYTGWKKRVNKYKLHNIIIVYTGQKRDNKSTNTYYYCIHWRVDDIYQIYYIVCTGKKRVNEYILHNNYYCIHWIEKSQ